MTTLQHNHPRQSRTENKDAEVIIGGYCLECLVTTRQVQFLFINILNNRLIDTLKVRDGLVTHGTGNEGRRRFELGAASRAQTEMGAGVSDNQSAVNATLDTCTIHGQRRLLVLPMFKPRDGTGLFKVIDPCKSRLEPFGY